jgi:hypothetical protein
MHRPPLPPSQEIFMVLIFFRLSRSQGHSVAGRFMLVKKSIDTAGNRTHYLPACSAVPQQTAPPRVPFMGCNAVHIGTVIDVSEKLVSMFRVVCKSTVLALS